MSKPHGDYPSYSLTAIVVHWLTALVVFSLFALGLWMVGLDYYSEWYQAAPHYHKSAGLVLAIVTLGRLIWRLVDNPVAAPGPRWQQLLASLIHGLLYLLLFGIFISGYLISTADGREIQLFNWFAIPSLGELFAQQEDIAGELHLFLAYGLVALVALHILAALKHHFIDKDNTLKRMLSPRR